MDGKDGRTHYFGRVGDGGREAVKLKNQVGESFSYMTSFK